MSASTPFTFSHRQSIKIALQFAGMDSWSCTFRQAAPCLLSVTVFGDLVNLSTSGFVPRAGEPCFLHHVPAEEASRIVEQFGEERMDGIDPPEGYATEEEAQELWGRLCAAFSAHQAALVSSFTRLTQGAA
jgi:hypothetical protein